MVVSRSISHPCCWLTVYVNIAQDKRTQLQPKAHRCVFVDYFDDSKSCRCYDPVIGQIISTNDATFFENVSGHFQDIHKFLDLFSEFDTADETSDKLLHLEDDNSEVNAYQTNQQSSSPTSTSSSPLPASPQTYILYKTLDPDPRRNPSEKNKRPFQFLRNKYHVQGHSSFNIVEISQSTNDKLLVAEALKNPLWRGAM